jgi:DNA-binding CsgD family transcriptional regulator
LERAEVLGVATSALSRAAQGEPSVVFIVGEPGLGKTSVLERCCVAGRQAGFSVQRAACSELEQSLPFGMLDRLFDCAGVVLAGGQTSGDGRAASEARLARYTRLLQWLRRQKPRRLLLAVDDLHWADSDSVELLSLLCRRLTTLNVAVIATCRPWPGVALDHARLLEHDHLARTCRLRPLSSLATSTLLAHRLGRQPDEHLAREAHEACAGNPLLISELASSLARGERPLALGGKLSERVFLPRFAGVGAPGMRLARAASALGSRFRTELATRLSGLGAAEAAEAAEALSTSGVLRELPDGTTEFVHPLLRKAIYEDLSTPARREMHSQALAILLDSGASASEAAPHAIGSQRNDPRAVAVLVDAGREALAAGAVGTAAEHFQAAANLAGASADPSLRNELVEACLLTGKLQLAAETLQELLQQQCLSTAERVRGMRLEAHLLMATARYAQAKKRWREASELAATVDVALAAETLLDGAFLGFLFEGQREAIATVLDAGKVLSRAASYERSLHPSRLGPPAPRRLRVVGNAVEAAAEPVVGAVLHHNDNPLAEGAQVREAVVHAHAYLACIGGDFSALDELMLAARTSIEKPQRRSALGWDAAVGYANLAKISERFADAQEMFDALLQEADHHGAALMFWSLAVNQADLLWRLGKLDQARELLARAAEATAVAPSRAPFAWVGLAHVSHEQGDDQASAYWAERVEEALACIGGSPYLRLWLAMLRCRRLLRAGEAPLTAKAGEQARDVAEHSGIVEPCAVPWHGGAIEALVGCGRLDEAQELVARLEQVCRPLPCRAPRAVAAWGGALVAWRRGQLEEARFGFQNALAHNAAVPMPLAEAETIIAYARFLRRTGQVTESCRLLRRALSVLEGTGARRLQVIASEELSGAGGRRRRARSPEELTSREQMVAALAAKGLTNAQIARALYVSSKTVDHHLSRAYAKLGVTSRRQLMLSWRPASPPEEGAQPLG